MINNKHIIFLIFVINPLLILSLIILNDYFQHDGWNITFNTIIFFYNILLSGGISIFFDDFGSLGMTFFILLGLYFITYFYSNLFKSKKKAYIIAFIISCISSIIGYFIFGIQMSV